MSSLLFTCLTPGDEEYLIAELAELGTSGITEEAGGIRAFFEDPSDAQSLARRFSEFAPEIRQEDLIDWEQVSRDAWPALPLGERFYLVPPWRNAEPIPPGRLRLEIFPGMACGTGRHPATQLCLQAIERCVSPGDLVLDVGSGSGILGRAAALMGAGRVIGCDLDPQAIGIARENYPSVLFFTGSVDAVQSHWADVIIANIDSATIEQLGPESNASANRSRRLFFPGFAPGTFPPASRPPRLFNKAIGYASLRNASAPRLPDYCSIWELCVISDGRRPGHPTCAAYAWRTTALSHRQIVKL